MPQSARPPRIVIVGGVAGGASAAARLRRLLEPASIVVFERGPYASFANCGLPYYLGGEITDRQKLLVASAGKLRGWLRLDVRTGCEVVAVDRAAQEVEVRETESGRVYREPFDFLILSPGASPLRPAPLLAQVGEHHPRVLSLRSIPDVDRLKQAVDAQIRSAVVIGGGFIGLEVAEQLTRRGVQTSLVELLPQVLPPLDAEMVTVVHEELQRQGVHLHLGTGVAGLEPLAEDRLAVLLQDGQRLTTDLVVLAIGVRPESQLATACGLEVNTRGAICVNDHLQTSDPRIYAVGDAIETRDAIFGGRAQIPLAGPANRQGRLAADHIAATLAVTPVQPTTLRYRGSQGTSIVRIFGVTAAMTGLSQKALARLGKILHQDYEIVVIHPPHHADYYPGAERMTLKLLCERPSGRVLGAQAVGGAGVDKRIDVIALAIQMQGTVHDLAQAELCYAPPFGSAKDPVNHAGFQAANCLQGLSGLITAEELAAASSGDAQRPVILDVRSAAEFAAGHIPAALHIPLDELRGRLAEVPTGRPLVTYCAVGMRGYLSERILRQSGWTEVRNLTGGFRAWQQRFPSPPRSS